MAYKGSIEPKLGMAQEVKSPPIISRMYKYKIEVQFHSDRNRYIEVVLRADPLAVVKMGDGWHFKVKTRLNYAEIFKLLIETERSYRYTGGVEKIRKIWWF